MAEGPGDKTWLRALAGRTRRLPLYARLIVRHPLEILDHLQARETSRAPENERCLSGGARERSDTLSWWECLAVLKRFFEADAPGAAEEPALVALEDDIHGAVGRLSVAGATVPFSYCADPLFARFCYVACRLAKPSLVMETGVAYGLTTAYILTALRENGSGVLHSVDLPPVVSGIDRLLGCLVPGELRARWRLHRGSSRRLLPRLLRELGEVDVFIHDSDHRYENVFFELRTAWPFLSPSAVVMADDIETNTAWDDWLAQANPKLAGVVHQDAKGALFGFAARRTGGETGESGKSSELH
jgi:predicted O-methyltransferase YrrM